MTGQNREERSPAEKTMTAERKIDAGPGAAEHSGAAGTASPDARQAEDRGRSRKNPNGGRDGKKTAAIAGIAAAAAAAACGALYIGMAQKYREVYFPHTTINGIDASGLTPEQVKAQIDAGLDGYVLTLEERGGQTEQILGEAVDLHSEYDGTLEQILGAQEPLTWGRFLQSGPTYTIETMVVFDQALLEEQVAGLDCLAPGKDAPQDAYLSDYIPGAGYQIVPEVQGDTADAERVLEAVADGVRNLRGTLSLEEADVYRKPAVTADSPELAARAELWNRYVDTTVTYRFGSRREVLDGERIYTWLSDDGQGGVALSEEGIAAYVAELAKAYNTAYQPKSLKTSYGPTVTIRQGFYGWRINQSAETAALVQILSSGESQEREPVYSQTAASHDGNDYGDTYVEINLTAQHLYFYKEGKLLVESDFVSGNVAKGWGTPAGAYPLTYKQKDAVLRGAKKADGSYEYESPVTYWMPFNGGIGMHDATWRSSFGGQIYKTGGSHGCINLPPSKAKIIFENISAGMPVLCYELDGTARGGSSSAGSGASSTKPAETTAAPAETVPETSAPEGTAPEGTAPENAAPETSAPAEAVPETGDPAQTAPAGTPGQPQSPGPGETGEDPGAGPEAGPGGASETAPSPAPAPTPAPETTAPAQTAGSGGPGAADGGNGGSSGSGGNSGPGAASDSQKGSVITAGEGAIGPGV